MNRRNAFTRRTLPNLAHSGRPGGAAHNDRGGSARTIIGRTIDLPAFYASRTATTTFRPTPDDERIINRVRRVGESTTDVVRRALRLLDREEWMAQARIDWLALRDEDLNAEPDAW
ncbi:hypothetical protein [Nocardia sp. NPDC050175]|uniref:hypothetical protein n=1 Tax=Nocardia sp. NPDC050175 TaxID=3364317 RepID=UPI0037A5D350